MSHIERLRLPESDPAFGGNKVFDLFQYSPAVTANGLAFVAGQIGIRADGSIPGTPGSRSNWRSGAWKPFSGISGSTLPTWWNWFRTTSTWANSLPTFVP